MRLTVLYTDTARARATVAPLHRWRRALEAAGVDVSLTRDVTVARSCRGVLLIVETGIRKILGDPTGRAGELALVDRAERRGTRVVWFDDADHTGRIRSYLLDRVSTYAKAQLPRDRTALLRPTTSGVITWDTLSQISRVEAPTAPVDRRAVEDRHLPRLLVGWDLAFAPRIWGPGWATRLPARLDRALALLPQARPSTTPMRDRPMIVSARSGARHDIALIAAHRAAVRAAVVEAGKGLDADVRSEGGLPLKAYRKELATSRVVVSPFGIGEICYRDYESAMAGAVAVKPDVSTIETFPRVLRAGSTYLSVRWDLGDLPSVLEQALDPDQGQTVAAALQSEYLEAVGAVGRQRFVDHVIDVLERTIATPSPATD